MSMMAVIAESLSGCETSGVPPPLPAQVVRSFWSRKREVEDSRWPGKLTTFLFITIITTYLLNTCIKEAIEVQRKCKGVICLVLNEGEAIKPLRRQEHER